MIEITSKEQIIDLLKNARLKKGMHQTKLAELIKTSVVAIWQMETHKKEPKIDKVLKTAKALGIKIYFENNSKKD